MSEYTTDHDLKSYEDLSEIDEARNVFLNEDIPNGVNVIDTIKKLKTLNNMLNSTKTWQEKFSEAFGVYWSNYKNTLYRCNPNDILDRPSIINSEDIKQFISDLIAQTREETIREIKEKLNTVIKYNSEISEDYQYAYSDLVDEINKLKK